MNTSRSQPVFLPGHRRVVIRNDHGGTMTGGHPGEVAA